MSTPRGIEQLRREHADMKRLLLVLDSHAARVLSGEEPDVEVMHDAVTYLVDYVDPYHHAREDLVVEMLAVREPCVALTLQHEEIRASGEALRERLACAVVGEVVMREDLVRRTFEYSGALRRNMAFEERSVFPLAEAELGAAQWSVIDAKIARRTDPLFGDAVHERYRALFAELTKRVGCDCDVYSAHI